MNCPVCNCLVPAIGNPDVAMNKHIDRCLRRSSNATQYDEQEQNEDFEDKSSDPASDEVSSNEEWDGEEDVASRPKPTRSQRLKRNSSSVPADAAEEIISFSKRQKVSGSNEISSHRRHPSSNPIHNSSDDWSDNQFAARVIGAAKGIVTKTIAASSSSATSPSLTVSSAASSSYLASPASNTLNSLEQTLEDIIFDAAMIRSILTVTKTEFGTYVDSTTWDSLFGYQKNGLKWFQQLYSDGLGGFLVCCQSIVSNTSLRAFVRVLS